MEEKTESLRRDGWRGSIERRHGRGERMLKGGTVNRKEEEKKSKAEENKMKCKEVKRELKVGGSKHRVMR